MERIEGILKRTGFVLDDVLGSRLIGLKNIISVLSESGDEQPLADESDELSLLASEQSAGFELLDVEGEPEEEVIFEKKEIERLNAVLKMLDLFEFEVSLRRTEPLLDDTALLKKYWENKISDLMRNFLPTLSFSEIPDVWVRDNYCERLAL